MNYYILVLKKYAVFTGRARRAEYWYYALFNCIASIILVIISKIIGDHYNILRSVYSIAVVVPSVAVGIRRMHDIGKSGWWLLINLIPLVGWIWFVVLAVTDSQPGDNKYGPNPKGTSSSVPPTPSIPQTPTQA